MASRDGAEHGGDRGSEAGSAGIRHVLEALAAYGFRVDDRIEMNRRRWDEMADLHVMTYDIERLDGEPRRLKPPEEVELGPVSGKRVCHLQCHLGGESLTLAERGAEVVGVDFSPRSIELARQRAVRAGLAHRVRFVCSTVDEAPEVVGGGFDLVYTSWGILCWLPDLDAWAEAVFRLLSSGGQLYLADTHPYAMAARFPAVPYGGGEAVFDDSQGDYTCEEAVFAHSESWEWSHGLGEVVPALTLARLHLDWLHEQPHAAWHLNARGHLVQRDDGMWEVPGSTLPLSFSLRATKP